MPKTVVLSVSMPENEFSAIEDIRAGTGFTRSEFMRFLIREGLRSEYAQSRIEDERARNSWGYNVGL